MSGVAVVFGTLSLAAPEASAASISASNSWGSFSCSNVKVWGGGGLSYGHFTGSCSVTDKLADGHWVYLQYNGIRNGTWDTGWHWMFSNHNGAHHTVSYSESISASMVDSWRVRVCKSVANATDPCGSWVQVS